MRNLLLLVLAFSSYSSFAEVMYFFKEETETKVNKQIFHTNDKVLNESIMNKFNKFNLKDSKNSDIICVKEENFLEEIEKDKLCHFFSKKNKKIGLLHVFFCASIAPRDT